MSQSAPVIVFSGGPDIELAGAKEPVPVGLCQIAGLAFFDHQLRNLAQQGVKRVVICLGKGQSVIKEIVKDGKPFYLDVQYYHEGKEALGSGGIVRKLLETHLKDDAIFGIVNGGFFLNAKMQDIFETFQKSDKAGLMTVYKGDLAGCERNTSVKDSLVSAFEIAESDQQLDYTECGFLLFRQEAWKQYPLDTPFDIFMPLQLLAAQGELLAYEVEKPAYNICTVEGAHAFEQFVYEY